MSVGYDFVQFQQYYEQNLLPPTTSLTYDKPRSLPQIKSQLHFRGTTRHGEYLSEFTRGYNFALMLELFTGNCYAMRIFWNSTVMSHSVVLLLYSGFNSKFVAVKHIHSKYIDFYYRGICGVVKSLIVFLPSILLRRT